MRAQEVHAFQLQILIGLLKVRTIGQHPACRLKCLRSSVGMDLHFDRLNERSLKALVR